MRQGEIPDRWDVNYLATSLVLKSRYADPIFPLVSLRELITYIQYGISAIATEEPVGIPMLRMNNLRETGWDLQELKYIELSDRDLEKYRLTPGDLLFNRTNSKELVGKCEVFNQVGDWVFASYLIRVRLDTSRVLPEFVSTFLSTSAGRLQIDRVSRQIIGMSNVNAEELQDLQIPLPPLDIQQTLIGQMESARAVRQAKLDKSKKLLNSIDEFVLSELGIHLENKTQPKIFAVRFGEIGTRFDVDYHTPRFRMVRHQIANTKHQLLTIAQIISHPPLTGFAAGRSDQTDDAETGIPHVRPYNITPAGEFILDSIKYVPIQSVTSEDFLQQGEVLFNNTNSTEWVGKTTVYDGSVPCVCSNHITRLRIKPGIANPHFVAILFNSLRSLRLFGLISTNFNNQAGINTETLLTLQIPLPELSMQEKVVTEIQNRRSESYRLRAEATQIWRVAKTTFEGQVLGGSSRQ